MHRFRVTQERNINGVTYAKVGDIVILHQGHDYGLVRDDEYFTGVAHIAVTPESGEGPFFTIPLTHVEELNGIS